MPKESNKLTKSDVLIWILVCIFLSPMLFFPVATDLSIFAIAGKAIYNGGKIYVDFIDIKQPLIYYLFAFINLIHLNSEFGLRFFDFILQIATIYLLVRTLKRFGANSIIRNAGAIVYSISYVAYSFNQIMQIETFAGILILLLVNIQLKNETKLLDSILAGFIIGLLTAFKFTFGIVGIAVICYDVLFEKMDFSAFLKKYVILIPAALITLLLSFSALLDAQILQGYLNAFKYLSFYAAVPPFSINLVSDAIRQVSYYFGYNYSMILFSGLIIAVYLNFKNENSNKLINLSILLFLALLFSIILERKFFVYHFIRLETLLVILSSYGIYGIYELLKSNRAAIKQKYKLLFGIFLICTLIFSPLTRWINLAKAEVLYFAAPEKYDSFYERENNTVINRTQQLKIAGMIDSWAKPGDKAIVMSTASNSINYYLKKASCSRFALSCFYFGEFRLPEWQKMIKEEVRQAKFIVVQINDGNFHAFGNYLASWDMLQQNTELYNYMISEFDKIGPQGHYIIFKRKK